MKVKLLEARRVSKSYAATVLHSVNLQIPKGDFTAILGAPGAGKSTLLRILGLLEQPDSGLLFWRGRLVTGPPSADTAELRRKAIGLLAAPEAVQLHLPVNPPELLLVDDPAPAAMTRLAAFNQLGLSIIIATRDPETALWCHTVYRLHEGCLDPLIQPEGGVIG